MTSKFKVNENRPFFGKFWPKGVPHELDLDYSMTVGQMFDNAVKKFGADPAMWFLETWLTYKEFGKMVDSFATYLHKIGIKKGDVIWVTVQMY